MTRTKNIKYMSRLGHQETSQAETSMNKTAIMSTADASPDANVLNEPKTSLVGE